MSIDKTVIYSKRYPRDQEAEQGINSHTPTTREREESQAALNEFWRRFHERVYIPIPGREELRQQFISLAKELSQAYEIDIDILNDPYSVEVNLHLYCAFYPDDMTRQIAKLFSMCDTFSSYILKTEPSDFTLSLDFYTHREVSST